MTLPVSYRITHHAMLMKSLCSNIFNSYNMINCRVVFFLFKYDLHPIFTDEPFTCVVNAHIRNDSTGNSIILMLTDITIGLILEMKIPAYIFEPLFPPLDWSDRQYYTRLPAKSWSKNRKLS